MLWTTPPTTARIKDAIARFFDLLPQDPSAAFHAVRIKPHRGKTPEETFDFHLHSLWEDLEDWLEDLDDPSFDGPWRSGLTPLRDVDDATLGWDFTEQDDPDANGEGTVMVHVHYAGEPTDCTARFDITRTADGYALALDSIRVM